MLLGFIFDVHCGFAFGGERRSSSASVLFYRELKLLALMLLLNAHWHAFIVARILQHLMMASFPHQQQTPDAMQNAPRGIFDHVDKASAPISFYLFLFLVPAPFTWVTGAA